MSTREEEPFFSRWSRLKREEATQPQEPARPASGDGNHEKDKVAKADARDNAALPPLESLTPQSDFRAFMEPKVQDTLRRVALKKLFTDPHFNAPDLFEPYSGDWTGEPIPEEMLRTLNQARTHLFPEEKKREEAEERERLAAEAAARAPQNGASESHAATTDTLEEKHDEPGRQDT